MIDGTGVVGQVTRVFPWSPKSRWSPTRTTRCRCKSSATACARVLGGAGNDGTLELNFVPLNADFENGDQLVTSGIDGIYPPGLPVAQV